MSTDALASGVWQSIIAVDDIDTDNFDAFDAKCTRHVVAVAKCLQTFAGGPLLDDDVDIYMLMYLV